ncbi:hypothetical protein HY311_02325, partial [Candidatus Nomurabacteria bacterium]|nr:hypothetical protein [Candidatus Nomurabacteria bacterium]
MSKLPVPPVSQTTLPSATSSGASSGLDKTTLTFIALTFPPPVSIGS